MSIKHVAIIQMDIAFGNPDKNYVTAEAKIAEAMAPSSHGGNGVDRVPMRPDVIVLPELWTTGYDLTRLDDIADDGAERTKTFISRLAKQHRVNIVAGSVANRTEDGVFNTMYTFNRDGELTSEYSKVHLFRLMDEEKYLLPGAVEGTFSLDGEPAAGFICYDIRFPEWIRKHVLGGARILFISAEWPSLRLAHWRTLLLARAIENQAYVIACNRAGSDPNNIFAGHSMIIDPWGEVVSEAGDNDQILFGSIDTDSVADIRSRIPIFEDRRKELY